MQGRYHPRHKPLSVSRAVWPMLAAIGDERKTRVFSEQICFDARESDLLTTSSGIFIFNRISDARKNGVFVMAGDADKTPHIRVNRPLGWFDVTRPDLVHYSSHGMVPMTGAELVFLSHAQVNAAYDVASNSMDEADEGRGSTFAAESVMIHKAHKLATSGAGSPRVFSDLARVAHYMGMPRAKAFAEQELELGQALGFNRRNRGGIVPKISG